MPSYSPVGEAIHRLTMKGWNLKALGKSPYNSVKPWTAEIYAGHFGSHFRGTEVKAGQYTAFRNSQQTIIGEGATAGEAMEHALRLLDSSPLKGLYERLDKAFTDNLNALQARNSR